MKWNKLVCTKADPDCICPKGQFLGYGSRRNDLSVAVSPILDPATGRAVPGNDWEVRIYYRPCDWPKKPCHIFETVIVEGLAAAKSRAEDLALYTEVQQRLLARKGLGL